MSDITDRVVALKAVLDKAQPAEAPPLTQGEIELELDRAKAASTWAASTQYVANAVVMPDPRNGRRYRARRGGTSGSTSPFVNLTGDERQIAISDGTENLLWVEDGPEYSLIYDVRQAAFALWDIRVGRTAQLVKDGDTSFEQLHEHCIQVRDSFTPLGVG